MLLRRRRRSVGCGMSSSGRRTASQQSCQGWNTAKIHIRWNTHFVHQGECYIHRQGTGPFCGRLVHSGVDSGSRHADVGTACRGALSGSLCPPQPAFTTFRRSACFALNGTLLMMSPMLNCPSTTPRCVCARGDADIKEPVMWQHSDRISFPVVHGGIPASNVQRPWHNSTAQTHRPEFSQALAWGSPDPKVCFPCRFHSHSPPPIGCQMPISSYARLASAEARLVRESRIVSPSGVFRASATCSGQE